MKIRVEVVYALADTQTIIGVELEQGARVADALAASGLAGPTGQSSSVNDIGIWGKPASPDTELRDRDRVEIYRDLVADPKQARRQRAKLQHGTKPHR
jgi:putative ubiquitin-RnfH superfamily antitoxin RatB of RatAB toxin-antitoxin module